VHARSKGKPGKSIKTTKPRSARILLQLMRCIIDRIEPLIYTDRTDFSVLIRVNQRFNLL
jgi:hypothetical protein